MEDFVSFLMLVIFHNFQVCVSSVLVHMDQCQYSSLFAASQRTLCYKTCLPYTKVPD
jgi:hypothetical protein